MNVIKFLFIITSLLILGVSCSSRPIKNNHDYIELPGKKLISKSETPHSIFDNEVNEEKSTDTISKIENTEDLDALDTPVTSTTNDLLSDTENNSSTHIMYYTVKSGDNLLLISKKLYSKSQRWKDLFELNSDHIKNPNRIFKGMKIKFVPDEGTKMVSHSTHYIIKKGDTLSKISKKLYGTYWKWGEIYNKNKSIVKNPNKIQIGIKLIID